MAAAGRSLRTRKKPNYALMNTVGLTEDHGGDSELEEGQLQESPLRVEASEDEFMINEQSDTTFTDSRYPRDSEVFSDAETALDYIDDVPDDASVQVLDNRQVVEVESENENENDIARDEVWNRQQEILKENREKRERIKIRLERQRQLAEEKLQEEQEKEEFARMQREIKMLNQKWRAMRDQRKVGPGEEMDVQMAKTTERKHRVDQQKVKTTASGRAASRKQQSEDDSDGESVQSYWSFRTDRSRVTSKDKTKIKSGYLDKPRSSVMVKHEWPHMNQDPRYITEPLMFNQLNFSQFVGGECRTIIKAEDDEEKTGRLRVLSKIAYLFNQCDSWDRARAAYFAIISSIEEGEAHWSSSFGHYDMMCPAPQIVEAKEKSEGRVSQNPRPRTTPRRDFFCKEFQKGDCPQASPHRAWVRNSMETVEHFCSLCYRAKLGKQPHVPTSEQCPRK